MFTVIRYNIMFVYITIWKYINCFPIIGLNIFFINFIAIGSVMVIMFGSIVILFIYIIFGLVMVMVGYIWLFIFD